MKRLTGLLGLLSIALLAAGCEDPCEKGFELKNELSVYHSSVSSAATMPSTLPEKCATFGTWYPNLERDSRFANRVAYDYFYTEEHTCMDWRREQYCYWVRHHNTRHWQCNYRTVCAGYRTIPHYRDGFNDAKNLSILLGQLDERLSNACSSYAGGNVEDAKRWLDSAESGFSVALINTENVLRSAGCYNRKGD